MADRQQLKLIRTNVKVWNSWREKNPKTVVDLRNAKLQKAHLIGANLRQANLYKADLRDAKLQKADLYLATLREASLIGANLTNANLECAHLVETKVDEAVFVGCNVYGIAAWDLKGKPKRSSDLFVTTRKNGSITVDDLQTAQFIHLLLKNKNVRSIIDTVTAKAVLILGRFTKERKSVLDAMRKELRKKKYGFTPILFDFENAKTKDLTGTVETLARLARFIIADLTNPSSIPHELATTVPFLRTTPVLPLRQENSKGYSMFKDLLFYPWVLKPHEYKNKESLIAELPKIIAPANKTAEILRKRIQ